MPALPPGGQKPYRLVGARLLDYSNQAAVFLAYRMQGRPISLLLSSAPQAAPAGGERRRSRQLMFHFSRRQGLEVIWWSDRGVHYALVSEVAGAQSCVICHGSAAERAVIEGLRPEGRGGP